jgi:hypothetical protein
VKITPEGLNCSVGAAIHNGTSLWIGRFLSDTTCEEETMGRGLLLWLVGVPIPVIILLWLFFGR